MRSKSIKNALVLFAVTFSVSLASFGQSLTPEQMMMLQNSPEAKKYMNMQGKGNVAMPVAIDPADTVSKYDLYNAQIDGSKEYYDQYTDKDIANKTAIKDVRSEVFGQDLFNKKLLNFAPSVNSPTPSDYILSAGDELYLNYWGVAEGDHTLTITKEGSVMVPNVGMIPLIGLTIAQAEQRIKSRMTETVSGLESGTVNLTLSLNKVRSIKVNIVGEAKLPGTYNLSSFSSLFNALYLAGGVNDIGSLRNIKLYRSGKLVATLDVYDYLINGKQDVNVRLENDDMVIIEPYNKRISVQGAVKRPLIFELKEKEKMGDLINYSGGFLANAYTENIKVRRPSENNLFMSLVTIPGSEINTTDLQNGDIVSVESKNDSYDNAAEVRGSVWRPGNYALDKNTKTVGDIVKLAQGVKPEAYLGRAHIFRLNQTDGRNDIIAINLGEIINGTTTDVPLQKHDVLFISNATKMDENFTIAVKGNVLHPTKEMPYSRNMTLKDALTIAGGMTEAASLSNIDVARRIRDPFSMEESQSKSQIFTFGINDNLSLSKGSEDFIIEPFDIITVRKSPAYQVQKNILVDGEILFPGEYTITTGKERISDIVRRSGGLTSKAFPKGAYLSRKMTGDEVARKRAVNQIMSVDGSVTSGINNVKVNQYYTVAIDLPAAMADTSSIANIQLVEGDILMVPSNPDVVRISGHVQYPNSVSFMPGANVKKYIKQAGGFRRRAARADVYMVLMNGSVKPVSRCSKGVEPGSEIIIPIKPDKSVQSAATTGIIISSFSALSTAAALAVSAIK